ncbi:MAG: tRNA glutamyl-Q(34) synthetase GluQRS [Rhodobiaceae bacterium]|nr:tRNA glutamyl-Q(34) synthetase GluQRS [Rhodobiaceae bacterium]
MSSRPVFRFAPSPNGLLHLGHAFSAFLNHEMARMSGGRFLVRIEDIDLGRARAEFEQQIFEDLAWLGLGWEEPVMRQSDRFDVYREALGRLKALDLVYPCYATRTEIRDAVVAKGVGWPQDPDGQPLYPGLWREATGTDLLRGKATGLPFAYRLRMDAAMRAASLDPDAALSWTERDPGGCETVASGRPADWGDVVIARKDVPTSYHLAVVVDDAAQGITHVVRGQDLRAATALHRLLQILLDLPEPLYFHHRLIRDDGGEKLAKSRDSASLKALRETGTLPSEIVGMLDLQAEFTAPE